MIGQDIVDAQAGCRRLLAPAAAGVLDAVAVLVFVAIGRTAHADGVTLAGIASTSWPFLAGAATGWSVARTWRRPGSLAPGGIIVWLSCVLVGMTLRVVAGQGTAAPFVGVALGFLGLEMLGWRLLVPWRRTARRG